MREAVEKLKILSWTDIKQEKFPNTSHMLYEHLVKCAQPHRLRQELEAERRMCRLELVGSGSDTDENSDRDVDTQNRDNASTCISAQGLTLPDDFKSAQTRAPRSWSRVVAQACDIAIDQMRVLLECHYDSALGCRARQQEGL